MVEDACQTAWTILLRRLDIPLDRQGLAWLRKVALTTGYRTARQREQPSGAFLPDPETGELPEPAARATQLDERVAERLDSRAQLETLTARELAATSRSMRSGSPTARSPRAESTPPSAPSSAN